MLLSIISKISLLCSLAKLCFCRLASYLTRPGYNVLTVLLEYIDLSICWVATYKTNIHHIDRRNTIQYIAKISPIPMIYHTSSCANNNYVCTRQRLHNAHFHLFYAGIMLDAFLYLLCWKLCWHNWHRPSSGAEGEEDGNDQMYTGNNVNTILEIHLNQRHLLNSCRVLRFRITPAATHYCHQHHVTRSEVHNCIQKWLKLVLIEGADFTSLQ